MVNSARELWWAILQSDRIGDYHATQARLALHVSQTYSMDIYLVSLCLLLWPRIVVNVFVGALSPGTPTLLTTISSINETLAEFVSTVSKTKAVLRIFDVGLQ